MVHDAGYEEEQLVEWGLARLAQNPSGQVDVGLRAIAPLDDCVELAAGYTWLPGWLP